MFNKPYTTYQYYVYLKELECANCHDTLKHHLLRYKTYLMSNYPIIPTRNTYYSVCPNCNHYEAVDDELLLMKLLQLARTNKPVVFNKFSFDEHQQINENSLESSIKIHIKHL